MRIAQQKCDLSYRKPGIPEVANGEFAPDAIDQLAVGALLGQPAAVAQHAQQLLNRISVEPGWKYLDVGCGVGSAAREIASTRPLIVTGIDATRLQFPDASFDIVATGKVTHHIPQWEKAFSEMSRAVRPGGYLIYSDLVLPDRLSRVGRAIVPVAGFPSNERLGSLARELGLTEVYRSRSFAQLDLIWRKSAT